MYLEELLGVEGKSDEALIKSFLECYVFKSNGFDLKDDDIKFLNEVSKVRKIIVLTDSDEAGEQIRQKINNKVSNTYNVFIDRKLCNKKGKHGVAESSKNSIIEALKDYIKLESPKEDKIETYQLASLGLNGESNAKEKRRYICKRFSLGFCNFKTMKDRLNILRISIDDVREAMKGYVD